MLDAAFERLCKEARYSRFFTAVRAVPDDILHPTAPSPQGHAVALVALSGEGSDQVLVGARATSPTQSEEPASSPSRWPMSGAVLDWHGSSWKHS